MYNLSFLITTLKTILRATIGGEYSVGLYNNFPINNSIQVELSSPASPAFSPKKKEKNKNKKKERWGIVE